MSKFESSVLCRVAFVFSSVPVVSYCVHVILPAATISASPSSQKVIISTVSKCVSTFFLNGKFVRF